MFANGERERGRESDWCRHVKVNHCIGGSTSRERERERDVCVCVCVCVCVLFEFHQFFFLLWELVYVFQSFVSIFAKKNLIVRDV